MTDRRVPGVAVTPFRPGTSGSPNQRIGWARVYLGDEPLDGSHAGFRGWIATDERGVRADQEWVEWLWPELGQYDSEWFNSETDQFVPWHRVYMIDWLEADPRGT